MVIGILALRAAALKKHANAVAKVSRLKAKGVDVAGTEFDVRRAWSTVKKYNSKQLESYMAQLDRFNSRTYRINALKDRVPLPLGRLEAYQRIEKKYNERVNAALDKYGELMPPGSGLTIRQREDMRKTVNGTANTENSILHPTHRDPKNIKDAASLDKLEAQLLKRSDDEYHNHQVSAARDSANQMMDRIGAADLKSQVAGLTDEQFDVLWSRTRFRDTLIAIYEEQRDSKGNANISDELADCEQLVQWAAGLNF